MSEVQLKFERENRDGIVAVGAYLIDAMKRLGIRLEAECVPQAGEHHCQVTILKGAENLSPMTRAEMEHLGGAGRKNNERLACHAKIEKAGEVIVMTKEKPEERKSNEQDKSEDFKKEFSELPLEKKIASLIQLEAIALGETFSFILNSPYMIFEKIGDVMAEFGIKLENESKAAKRPEEHKEENGAGGTTAKKRGGSSTKTAGAKKTKHL